MNTQTQPERNLPAYRITRSDGSSYITSMSSHVTLETARNYFLGTRQVVEDEATGKETRLTVTQVDVA
jgi:hypothetical protein